MMKYCSLFTSALRVADPAWQTSFAPRRKYSPAPAILCCSVDLEGIHPRLDCAYFIEKWTYEFLNYINEYIPRRERTRLPDCWAWLRRDQWSTMLILRERSRRGRGGIRRQTVFQRRRMTAGTGVRHVRVVHSRFATRSRYRGRGAGRHLRVRDIRMRWIHRWMYIIHWK